MIQIQMLLFQVGCTYVLLSSIRVNVFHFHVACNHCSSTCFLDHICDTVTRQTPNPGTRWAAIWWSTSSPQGSLSFLILGYPNLGKLPILIDFIKEKEKTGPTKTGMICLAIGQSQPGIFYLQKLWISKKHTLFIKGKKYLNQLNSISHP